MPKSLVPIHPHLRTKAQRCRCAKQWRTATALLAPPHLDPNDLTVERVEICVGSRRKNTKGIKPASVAQIFHATIQLSIVKLSDGRFVFLDSRRRARPRFVDAVVSHDLENLWWYGVDQPAREIFMSAIAKAKP